MRKKVSDKIAGDLAQVTGKDKLAAGQRYGSLVAISRVWVKSSKPMWLFQCDCGKEHTARGTHVRGGRITSCGCDHNRVHGMSGTPEYVVWNNMLQRCFNPRHPSYYAYGARGIAVCERWHSFENFFADVGVRPSPDLSIDRIDNDGDYEPNNVRWGTLEQQLSTRRGRGPNRSEHRAI